MDMGLKNIGNLTEKQENKLDKIVLRHANLKTMRAFHLRLSLQEFYETPAELAEEYLKKWYAWAIRSRLKPVVKVAKSVKRHWDGVLRQRASGITNGLLEGINSLIQAAKAKARGFRSNRNLIAAVYLTAGKLDIKLPT